MKKFITFLIISTIAFFPTRAYSDNNSELLIQTTKQSHDLIKLSEAHNLGYTGKDQVIVVIDSGISDRHEAFSGKIIDGYCSSRVACGEFFMKSGVEAGSNRRLPGYDFLDEHGSLIGSIAAGNKTNSFTGGIAPDAKIISINNQEGNGDGLILAFDWIISMKKKYNIVAINASFGFPGSGDRGLSENESACPKDDILTKKIEQMYNLGIAFVAAAGNGGSYSNVNYPACTDYAIAVGALTSTGNIANYSDIGREIDVLAPADVMGAHAYNGYWIGGGTSSATPVVVGAIALLKQANPNATIPELIKALGTSDTYKNDIVWGNLSVLNLPMAINAIKSNSYLNKTVTRISKMSTENVSDILKIKQEFSLTIADKENQIKDLTNQINDLKKINNDLVNKQNLNNVMIDSLQKQNIDILKKVKIICSSKSRSALCKSLGL